MNDDVYYALLDASAEVIAKVYALLDEQTKDIVDDALGRRFRLATVVDATGLLVVLVDDTSGQTEALLASVNARTGKETLYALRRETQ
ncbi:hypothetical protein [Paraburkholderia metrosideri]|uniref:Uncharacterized protein n=1 Tax=Paraburkholderia metrosideri TaxID=580937 RepID=A0ABM8P1L2_9BURK|nr:hypothetical protein [Paraburkholderia metrosideri]CAD6553500.1 hypothetical protein LMG28140_05307 [Paraburkholderia metrosideri]